ncbi:MAG: FtsW/RodA/SpoVE family cell cycle protein [candidate division WOR-3 bacterium]
MPLRTSESGTIGARNEAKAGLDLWIALPVFILLAVGALIVYTSSSYLAQANDLPQFYFFMRHLLRLLVAVLVLILMYAIPAEFWERHSGKVFWLAVVLLVALFFLGKTALGARRWFMFGGFSFQPSDLAKLSLVVFLARFMARKDIKSFRTGFLPALGATGILVGLVLLEPAVSTSAILALVGIFMLFIGGAKLGHLMVTCAVAALVFAASIRFFPHAKERVESFTRGGAYQVTQAKIGLAEGGLIGVGPGKGKEKFLYLPKPHTDFIYAVVGEELGLVGSLAVLGLLTIIVLRGIVIANRLIQRERFLGLLGFGASGVIGLYGLAHMSVVLGLLPPTGLALPFISYGGSSLVLYSGMAGVLLNLSRRLSQWNS